MQHDGMPRPAQIEYFAAVAGNYEEKHPAYFIGLLDEVIEFDLALSAYEVRQHYQRMATAAQTMK